MNARETERGVVITLGDMVFEFNKAEIKPGAGKTVEKLAVFIKQYPERKLLIEGYTDSSGDSNYNLELSSRRANAIRNILINLGVGGERVTTQGYGEDNPTANNETHSGRTLDQTPQPPRIRKPEPGVEAPVRGAVVQTLAARSLRRSLEAQRNRN